ncbi:O-antigen ligase family protein [Microbacterium sp. LWH11-1.2]|uniref:O-antigen ligase family protein n=1 Tax=Microbacterium sp. LWH11-1.2 TaxID=3135258 RepID=UPI0031389C1B
MERTSAIAAMTQEEQPMVWGTGRVPVDGVGPVAVATGSTTTEDAASVSTKPAVGRVMAAVVYLLPALAAFGPLIPGIGSLFAFRLAAVLLLIVALLSKKGQTRSATRTITLILAVTWLFVTAVGLLVAGPSSNTFSELLSLLTGLAILIAIAIARAPVALLMALLRGWLLAYGVISVYAVIEIVTGFSLSSSYADERALDGWGITVSFYNPNNYATFLLFSYIALVVLWSRSRGRGTRLAAALAIITVPVFMAATNSRTGVLILAVFVLVSIFLALRARPGLMIMFLLLTLVALILVLEGIAQNPFEGYAQYAGTSGYAIEFIGLSIPIDISTFVRWQLVLAGLTLAGSNLALGGGAGSFEDYVDLSGARGQTLGIVNPHNGFIEVLSQYGAIVFVVFIIWLFRMLQMASRARRRPNRFSSGGWMVVAVGIVCLPFILTMHSSAIEPSTTWIYFAMLLLIARSEEEPQDDEQSVASTRPQRPSPRSFVR